MTQAPLYRQEVLDAGHNRWLGGLTLRQPAWHWLLTATAIVIACVVVVLLFFCEYARKARVEGILLANPGLVDILAPADGMVEPVAIREGSRIESGAVIGMLKTDASAFKDAIPIPGVAGTITALHTHGRTRVRARQPLLTIMRPGSRIEANLYLPSRLRGAVTIGDEVLLRFDAYPYQRYGQYSGHVVRIADSPLKSENANTIACGNPTAESLFRVVVALDKGTVSSAHGEQNPLLPGLRVEADIVLDRLRLYAWISGPFQYIANHRL